MFLALLGREVPADAQDDIPAGCNPALIASSARLRNPYQVRAGYCDGTVSVPHRGELPLVSITIGRIAFGSSNRLAVRVLGTGNRFVRVRGSDVRSGRSYRLDGTVGPSGLTVALAPAAIPSGISDETLGLRAWINTAQGPLYFPVLAGGNRSDDILLTLRTDEAAIRVVRWICENNDCGTRSLVNTNLPEGGLIHVSVPRGSTARQVQVKVVALHAGNRQTTQLIDLHVPAK